MVTGTCPGLSLPQGTPPTDPCNNTPCDQSRTAAKLWVRLDDEDLHRVSGAADTRGMERVREVAARCAIPREAVWERVRRGEFEVYRAPRASGGSEWWLAARPTRPNERPPSSSRGKADA